VIARLLELVGAAVVGAAAAWETRHWLDRRAARRHEGGE